jgi:hypothetical protein
MPFLVGEDQVLGLGVVLEVDDRGDPLVGAEPHAGDVRDVHAATGPRGLRDLVDLGPVHLAAVGEHHQPVVGGRGEDLADDVVLLEIGPDDASSAAALAPVGLDGQALHVTGA